MKEGAGAGIRRGAALQGFANAELACFEFEDQLGLRTASIEDRRIERIAMQRFHIPDIRMLFENDVRFLNQFKSVL